MTQVPVFVPAPDELAGEIAEEVALEWRRSHGPGRLAIPLSAIAPIALNEGTSSELRWLRRTILSQTPEQFAVDVRAGWRLFGLARPELITPAFPLMDVWWGEVSIEGRMLANAKRVADAALRAGLLELTGTDRRMGADVFGRMLTALRSRADVAARGQYYTPAAVSEALARLDPDPAAATFVDPTCGTGGLIRAVAVEGDWQGIDPARRMWVGADIDELAIACAAVNAVIWGLGRNVVLGVGDILAEYPVPAAVAQRTDALAVMAKLRSSAALLEYSRRLEAALRGGPDTPPASQTQEVE
jgi:hypothetical protein